MSTDDRIEHARFLGNSFFIKHTNCICAMGGGLVFLLFNLI